MAQNAFERVWLVGLIYISIYWLAKLITLLNPCRLLFTWGMVFALNLTRSRGIGLNNDILWLIMIFYLVCTSLTSGSAENGHAIEEQKSIRQKFTEFLAKRETYSLYLWPPDSALRVKCADLTSQVVMIKLIYFILICLSV